MSSQVTPSGATGAGTQTLTFAMGKNQTRANKTYTFKASANGGSIISDNTLVITQAFASLSITSISSTSQPVGQSASAQDITVTGTANGKYLKCYSNGTVTVQSCVVGSQQISTSDSSYTQVNAFEGGSSVYTYSMVIRIPANTAAASYSVVVKTADTDSVSATSQSVTYTVTVVAEPVSVDSVSISPNTLTLGVNQSSNLSVTVLPSNATNKNVNWETSNSSIATVNSAGSVTGKADGSATITARSVESLSKYDTCSVRVYADGTISAQDVMVASIITSASTPLSLFNMKRNTLSVTVPSGDTWITNATIDTSGTPVYVRLTATSNGMGATYRSSTITVSGDDELGHLKTCDFIFTQNAPSSSDIPCETMTITPSGSVSISDAGNTQQFDLAYSPTSTTQHGAIWSLTDTNGSPVSSSIAQLVDDPDPVLTDTKHVVIGSSASNNALRLKATNSYNSQIVSNTVNITATYVAAGDITSDTYSVTMAYNDDRNDTTNGAPTLTGNNLSGSIEVASFDGFISTATISGNRLITTFTFNSGAQRTGSVTVRDSGNYSTTATINYIQLAYQNPGANTIQILAIEGVPSPSSPTEVKFAVQYNNIQITREDFTNQSYTLVGKNSQNEVTFSKTMQSLNDVSIAARKSEYRIYTVAVEPSGTTTSYNLTVNATSVYQNISASVTGCGGDDPIDE